MNLSDMILSNVTGFTKYCKYLPHLYRRETLEETINRCMNMHLDRFPKLSTDIVKSFQKVHERKVSPSMRSMQFGGNAIEKNNIRQYNCSYAPIDDVKAFSEGMFILLSGAGFGYSVQKRHVNKLPKIQSPRESGTYIVHDSIIGWAEALNNLLEAYFYGKIRPEFDFSGIRAKGSYLVTTGAKAPGPEPLKAMLKIVEEKLIQLIGKKIKPIEAHDIMCISSDAVYSGGIRRAALIVLFDKDDNEMLTCKSGTWWEKHPHRARANNSVVLHRSETTYEEFCEIFKACKDSNSGEPGFFWTNDYDFGTNPCCFTGNMNLKTPVGYKTFEELSKLKGFIAYNINNDSVKAKVWSTGKKTVIKLKLISGSYTELVCTPDHRLMTFSGETIIAGDSLGKFLKIDRHNDHAQVWAIEEIGEEEVFDFSLEDSTHWGIVNGVIAHNCEIALQPNQFCNLTTVNQSNIKDKRDFMNRIYSASLIGTLQASYTDFHYLRPIWKDTTEQEALLGISFTGIADGNGIVTNEWLREGAQHAMEVNKKYAKKLGINPAARVTAVKPEGTASCILGSSSGIHARHSEYYIRRLRFQKNEPLAVYLMNTIPELVEQDNFNPEGVIVTIPQKSPSNSIIRHNETAESLFRRTIDYNENWIKPGHVSGSNKHNVSVTISVKEHEWDSLREMMWEEREKYTGISLLPFDSGTYIQAPFTDSNEEEYTRLISFAKEIDLTLVKEENDNTNRLENLACINGLCDIT